MELVAIQFDNFEEEPILNNRGRNEYDKFCFFDDNKGFFSIKSRGNFFRLLCVMNK